MKKGSIKNNRINGEVMRALSVIIRDGVKDPRIDPLFSITKVEVTPDLQFCKVQTFDVCRGIYAFEKTHQCFSIFGIWSP